MDRYIFQVTLRLSLIDVLCTQFSADIFHADHVYDLHLKFIYNPEAQGSQDKTAKFVHGANTHETGLQYMIICLDMSNYINVSNATKSL